MAEAIVEVDFGMNIQAAPDEPRFTKLSIRGCDVELESRITGRVRKELGKPWPIRMDRGQPLSGSRPGCIMSPDCIFPANCR